MSDLFMTWINNQTSIHYLIDNLHLYEKNLSELIVTDRENLRIFCNAIITEWRHGYKSATGTENIIGLNAFMVDNDFYDEDKKEICDFFSLAKIPSAEDDLAMKICEAINNPYAYFAKYRLIKSISEYRVYRSTLEYLMINDSYGAKETVKELMKINTLLINKSDGIDDVLALISFILWHDITYLVPPGSIVDIVTNIRENHLWRVKDRKLFKWVISNTEGDIRPLSESYN